MCPPRGGNIFPRMAFYLKILGALVLVLAIIAGGIWYWVTSSGQKALLDVARQAQLCKTDDCSEGLDEASSFLAQEFGLTPGLVKWCIGVDSIAGDTATRPNHNGNWFIETLYQPCGEPIVE